MKKFSIKEWQSNTLNEAPVGRDLNYLKDNYYGIADELSDIHIHINDVLGSMDGKQWADDNNIDLKKELKIFKQIERLFDKSKLGKVL
jgi:hypothetical protein